MKDAKVNINSPGTLNSRAFFLRPCFMAAVAVCLANDHLLKGSGVLPSLVTGKLSDFAGLFFFPPLVVALLQVSRPRGVALVYLVTALLFSFFNIAPLSSGLSSWLQANSSSLLFWPDYWDLLALPVLPLSWFVLARVPREGAMRRRRRWLEYLMALSAVITTGATSIPGSYEPYTYVADPISFHYSYSVGYSYQGFREGVLTTNNFLFVQPNQNRVVELGRSLSSGAVSFSRSFSYVDGIASWSVSDQSFPLSAIPENGFESPLDIALEGDGAHFWVLDNNRLRRFNYDSGALVVEALLPGDKIFQIEYDASLSGVGYKQATGEFYFVELDSLGGVVAGSEFVFPTTQVESSRGVVGLRHYRKKNSLSYLLFELSTAYVGENTPYFLELRSSDLSFYSGIFLYEASAISPIYDDGNGSNWEVLVTGRQRNYESELTYFDGSLNRTQGAYPEEGAIINGALYRLGSEYILLSFDGLVEIYHQYQSYYY